MRFYEEEISRLFKSKTFTTPGPQKRFGDFINEGWRISH
jgi:hypothetical protein